MSLNNDFDLEKALIECDRLSRFVMEGRIDQLFDAIARNPWAEDFYVGYASCIGHAIEAGLTIDRDQMRHTMSELQQTIDQVNRYRFVEKSWFSSIDYSALTEIQLHAEVCYAELSFIMAGVALLADQSIRAFVNGAIYFRRCYSSYSTCLKMLSDDRQWSSERARNSFESRARLGSALFDLGLSCLPGKLIRLIELIGLRCNRENALDQLRIAIKLGATDHFLPIMSFILVHYYCFTEYAMGMGEADNDAVEQLIDNVQRKYKGLPGTRYLLAMKEAYSGNLDRADELLRSVLNDQHGRLLQIPCNHFLYWVNIFRSRFSDAAPYMAALKECNWSRAAFTFNEAGARFMALEQTRFVNGSDSKGSNEMIEEEAIKELLRQVPKIKKNFGGSYAFHEKFVIEKAKKHQDNLDGLMFPQFEKGYIFNFFSLYGKDPGTISKIKQLFQTRLDQVVDSSNYLENRIEEFAFLTFFMGVTEKQEGQFDAALKRFKLVLDLEKNLKENLNLVPQSCYEIGLIKKKFEQFDEAIDWLKKAKSYGNHFTEVMIKYKSQLTIDSIKRQLNHL